MTTSALTFSRPHGTGRPVQWQCPAPLIRQSTLSRPCRIVRRLHSERRVVLRAGKIQEVDAAGLEVEIANRSTPLVIDFFATWCGPCVMLAEELDKVVEKIGDTVKVIKIDVDKNPDISSALQIQGLPTLIFLGMDPSKPALRTEGLLPAASIMDILEKEL